MSLNTVIQDLIKFYQFCMPLILIYNFKSASMFYAVFKLSTPRPLLSEF